MTFLPSPLAQSGPQPRPISANQIWLGAYLLLLLYGPGLLRSASFVARGIRLDQLLLLATWPVLVLVCNRRFREVLFSPLGIALAILPALSAAAGLVSLACFEDTLPGTVLAQIWGFSRPILVFVAVATLIQGGSLLSRHVWVTLIVALSIGLFLFAVAQVLQFGPAVNLALSVYGRRDSAQLPLLRLSLLQGRAWSTFDGQANAFGSFWVVLLSLQIAQLAARRGSARAPLRLVLLLVVMMCSSLGLLLTGSRGAMAGVGAALAVVLVRSRVARSLPIIAVVVVMILLGVNLLPPQLLHRVQSLIALQGYGGAAIYETRMPYWREDVAYWLQNPLLGAAGRPVAPPDNLYLSLLVNGGLVLTIWQLACVALVVHGLYRIVRQPTHPLREIALGMLAATVGLLVNGVSAASLQAGRVQDLYWFLIAVVLAGDTSGPGAPAQAQPREESRSRE